MTYCLQDLSSPSTIPQPKCFLFTKSPTPSKVSTSQSLALRSPKQNRQRTFPTVSRTSSSARRNAEMPLARTCAPTSSPHQSSSLTARSHMSINRGCERSDCAPHLFRDLGRVVRGGWGSELNPKCSSVCRSLANSAVGLVISFLDVLSMSLPSGGTRGADWE